MSVAVSPVFPVVALQGTRAVALPPQATVVDATVLKLLEANFVRLAIANMTIDVMADVPLVEGQVLQVGVTQTPQGVRLQILPPAGDAGQAGQTSAANDAAQTGGVQTPKADASVRAAAAGRTLTNLEALAVSAAIQTAAARQGSLSPLFANLRAAMSLPDLPQTLQEAAARLLMQQTPLGKSFTGEDLKTAFRTSGLFLEQSLARMPSPASPAEAGAPAAALQQGAVNTPDLKAALIVFRQTVAAWLDQASPEAAMSMRPAPSSARSAQTPTAAAPPLAPEIEGDVVLPQTVPLLTKGEGADGAGKIEVYAPDEPLPTATSRAAMAATGLAVLQEEALQALAPGSREVAPLLSAGARSSGMGQETGEHTTLLPPPPFPGAAPSAQAAVPPSISPDDSPVTVAHHLIDDADAALARQTLLQAASLPDRPDVTVTRTDLNGPRWNFEVPFATPRGTAVAQFEISRDGGGNGAGGSAGGRRIWRARFSLDVEPSGPVHALVSLSGGRTSVRMWAERPTTAAQLRLNAPDLMHALREAALEPGDIVIGDGTPPPSAQLAAGHFLDRAL